MEDLRDKAAQCGIDDPNLADLAVGGYLCVLHRSTKLREMEGGDKVLPAILAELGSESKVNMKQYEKIADKGLSFFSGKKPLAGLFSGLTGIQTGPDEDAKNTQAMIATLQSKFEGFTEAKLVKFMKAFVAYVQDEVTEAVDIDTILKLPA